MSPPPALTPAQVRYNRFLLLVAGLGGLLYGVDVGIIAGALPYLEATSGLNAGQLSFIVAAVLLGSVISTLFAGLLADWMGRKSLMTLSGALFVASIPMIALAHGYGPLVFGRLLQGISAGLIGVVLLLAWFAAPTLDKSLTWVALILCALLILTPVDHRWATLTFVAGSGLGYFLERWGTTRECWTYYTKQTPPLFAVLAHGMACVAFWRARIACEWAVLKFARGVNIEKV